MSKLKIDSRKINKSDIFFDVYNDFYATNEFKLKHSLEHIIAAYKNGAKTIFTDKIFQTKYFNDAGINLEKVSINYVSDIYTKLIECLNEEFKPGNIPYVSIVTGTNGKTSCVYYAKGLSEFFGLPSICVGTSGLEFEQNINSFLNSKRKIENKLDPLNVNTEYEIEDYQEKNKYLAKLNEIKEECKLTTNDILLNHHILLLGGKLGKKSIHFELSSHGFRQNRMKGILADCFIITSIGSDHLDYHKTLEEYINTKLSMICTKDPKTNQYISSGQIKNRAPIIITNQIYQEHFLTRPDMIEFILNNHKLIVINLYTKSSEEVLSKNENVSIEEQDVTNINNVEIKNTHHFPNEIRCLKYEDIVVIGHAESNKYQDNIGTNVVILDFLYALDQQQIVITGNIPTEFCTINNLNTSKTTKISIAIKIFASFQISNFLLSFINNLFNLKSNGAGLLDRLETAKSFKYEADDLIEEELIVVDEIATDPDKPNYLIKLDMTSIKNPPGRMEMFTYKNNTIFIDYAHNPDGLKTVLTSLRSIFKNKLIVVFGCGGNRDKTKRPEMGKLACSLADYVIITDDNPRQEDPSLIRSEILLGANSINNKNIYDYENQGSQSSTQTRNTDNISKVKEVPDRYEAIRAGIEMLSGDCILLIAGKGSENYQEIAGIKHNFSDKDVVLEIIYSLKANRLD